MKSAIVIAFCISIASATAQTQYTPYDDLPGIIKSYKPAYETSYPGWAQMLYEYPVNYFDITRSFENRSTENRTELATVIRYYKIWRRQLEPWVLDDGTIQLPDMNGYYNSLKTTQLAAGINAGVQRASRSDWTYLGPKETFWLNESGSIQIPKACPWQVNVYSFDVSSTDNNILFCGTETGFVNKSTDQGQAWQLCAWDYYFGGGVTATVIHPVDADIVYVAAGNQVHKTTDGGNTWTPMLEMDALFYADRLKIDYSDPEKILAASNSGVHISTNGGQSWERPWTLPSYDVEIKPDDNNTIFAMTKISGKFSVIVSTDGGLSFESHPNFPTDLSDVSGGLLAVTPANPNLLLAVMLSSDNTPYLYKGTIDIGSWSLLATGQTGYFPMNNGQGYFDLVLEVSPTDENLIFAGTTTLFRSVNGGQNFTAIGGYTGAFSIHPDIQDMKLLPNGDTWVSTDGGFTLTTDNFSSTANYVALNNGLVGSDMWGFDQGWNEDIVVGGRYHNGNTAIADFYQPKALRMGGAESPTGWVLQGKSRHVAFNDLGNGWILPKTAEREPEGRFIFSKYPNMDEYGGRRSNMAFHPNFWGTIYLGEGNGFWKSLDMGVTFDLLHNFDGRVRYLQISYHNPDVLYADVVGKGLYRSDDGGQNWESKPSLTGGQYGNSSWKGNTFIAISPYDENRIYACLMNGTWSANIGKVFRSINGGDTWENWTGSLSEHTKCMVIQPTSQGKDLVYLFTNAKNGQRAKVFHRGEEVNDWIAYNNNYPAGMAVNMALPFFRDSKLRVAGLAGVWESAMAEPEFTPIINPWVEKPFYNCMTDTLYFDDHSILNHDGASWQWAITPEPVYINDANIRNPKVVLGSAGTYSVNFTVIKNGETYSKYMQDMITATTCPSIEDCSNPAEIPKDIWELLYVDSQETGYPGLAIMAFDDDPSTIWHTRWSSGSDPYPHEIQVDMGEIYKIYEFIYLNRQDGQNGRIREYELYITEDTLDWGNPVNTGEFENTAAPQTITFEEPPIGQYFRLLALSEVNGNAWASAAEFSVVGCTD
nr:discoidin domain-containing protein [Bacteroidota bacterium]